MGAASPYRARFSSPIGRDDEDIPGDGGEKYFGLVNVKNTCYVNSVLQALYFCSSFRRSAIRHLQDEDDSERESLLNSLGELFAQIESQKRNVGCLTPRRFLSRLRKANDLFGNSEHQDAHEFLQFLLNDICDAAKKRAKKSQTQKLENGRKNGDAVPKVPKAETPEMEIRTWVHDILQGYLVNQMKCLCCENVTARREEFFDLSVDIEQCTSIAACLRAFESTEHLRANNKFFCDTCGCLQEAEKRLRIYQLPSVLTLHLKRFKYVERLGRSARLPYRVVFPLQLRVVEHRQASKSSSGRSRNQSADPPPLEAEEKAEEPTSRLYDLRSVVVHIGRDATYGHYVTVVRNGDRCVLLDDDVVRVVDPSILRSFYGNAGSSSGSGQGSYSDRNHGGGWSGGGGSTGSGGGHNGTSSNGSGGGGSASSSPHISMPMPGERFGSDRFLRTAASGVPYYERAPEGTCCGYLLIYEAVDKPGAERQPADFAHATDWISEGKNFSDSESSGDEDAPYGYHHNGNGTNNHRHSHSHSGSHRNNSAGPPPTTTTVNPVAAGWAEEDIEHLQSFEQRCLPSGPSPSGIRNPQSATLNSIATAAGGGGAGFYGTTSTNNSNYNTLNSNNNHHHGASGGGAASFSSWTSLPAGNVPGSAVGPGSESSKSGRAGGTAWTIGEGEGRTLPQPTSTHVSLAVRTSGAVVPAAGAADEVSLSRVNVGTLPSPTGSAPGLNSSADSPPPPTAAGLS